MPLRKKAYLVLENDNMGTGVFELESAEEAGDFDRQLAVGNRGQLLKGVATVTPDLPGGDTVSGFVPDIAGGPGAGFNLDLGIGTDTWTLDFQIVTDESASGPAPEWGNGSSGISREDAQGAHPQTQLQVLRYWLRTTRTDSANPAFLYYGDWSTGRFADDKGVFDEPIPVVVNTITPRWERDDPSAAKATIELLRTNAVGDVPTRPDARQSGFSELFAYLDDLNGDGP